MNLPHKTDPGPNVSSKTCFFTVAVNVPLWQFFTYHYPVPLPPLTRVIIPFRNKEVVGMVMANTTPDPALLKKIKKITAVLDSPPLFNDEWRRLMLFTASYYFYPPGAAIFAALPPALKNGKKLPAKPKNELLYRLTAAAAGKQAPPIRFHNLNLLWTTLKTTFITLEDASFIHPRAEFYLNKYQQAGWLQIQPKPRPEILYNGNKLNAEQETARAAVAANLGKFKPFLLFGITGSGKTEVYFSLINEVLRKHRQVLLLLPIINLTPQFFSRLKAAFPQTPVALLHSKIPAATRCRNFIRAGKGDAAIIVGTRLAVFTPMVNPGLIIVDEEHDDSYKQENELRYHARDLAVWRAQRHDCPVILGSATPSLRSWYQTKLGNYQLLTLKKRANPAALLPEINFIRVHPRELQAGFMPEVLHAIAANLNKKQLTLVYLNRRGFSPTLLCPACGQISQCDFCSTRMVYHKEKKQLICHHCAAVKTPPRSCPACGNQDLVYLGQGTEKITEFLQDFFPAAKVIRVDSDTLSKQHSWEQIYNHILYGEVDIIVGTQLLAKGHDFAAISLVAVIDADYGLFSADYRAGEKLFSELMQVAGRAGRAATPGKVLIQTQFPQNPLLAALKKQDYAQFADAELNNRNACNFPPQTARIVIKAEHKDGNRVNEFLTAVKTTLNLLPDVQVLGPVPMNPIKLAGMTRAILYFDAANRENLRQTLKQNMGQIRAWQKNYPQVKWAVDVDSNEA